MRKTAVIALAFLVLVCGIAVKNCPAQETRNGNPINGNVNFGRTDPAKFNLGRNAHGGAGTIRYMELTPREKFKTQFLFIHRGELDPKSSIGEHAHRKTEEMYFVMDDGVAEFTIDGRTALLPGPCMALCPMGSSHGIYNPMDRPIQWMNVGVTYENRQYDAVNFGKKDDLASQTLESPPSFKWSVIDKRLLGEVPTIYEGEGTMLKNVIWDHTSFKTNFGFVNHYVVPPGVSVPYHRHPDMEEIYYILSGIGRMTIDDVTIDVRAGDCGSVTLNGAHGIYNNSNEDLELLAIGCSVNKGVFTGIRLHDNLKNK